MHSDDPTRADRERERRRRAERRRRRREDAGDAVEDGGEIVGGVGDLADLATGGAPTPGFGGGRGGGGWCDGIGGRGGGRGWCDGFGSGGGGGRGGGGGGCDGCDCNLTLLQVALLAGLVGPRAVQNRMTRGPRLSTVLLVAATVLPHRAGPAVAAAIRLYRRRLTRFTPACPGTPSCSTYALAAVEDLGARRGLRLAVARVRGCAPTR